MQHCDILDHYRRLRAISTQHHSAALGHLSRHAIMEQAKRLGLAHGQVLLDATEEEMTLAFDLAVHTARPGRTRTIDRYAKAARLPPNSEEAHTLQAIRNARFSIWRLECRHEAAGIMVTDLLHERETWLVDEGLTSSGKPGLAFASRLFWPATFAMTCGVAVPLNPALIEDVMLDGLAWLRHSDPDQLADDSRFAAEVYRAAIGVGIMDQVAYREIAVAA